MFVVSMTDARRKFRIANLTGRGPRRQRFFATLNFDLWTLNFSFALVNQALPFVTVVIPTRPEQAEIPALTASRALDYPREQLELLVARGRQPAVQRNAALKAARGELIYFLDDDSTPQPGNLRRAVSHFSNPEVQLVGGPNLCPPDAPAREQVFAVALASWLAFWPSRARYDAVGRLRETSEKELILCNLVARRDALQAAGGFDESLYPNEENALMDTLQKRGAKLLYDPELVVYRRPRPTLKAFGRMLMTYGRGRAEQFRLHPTAGSLLNWVPPLFCVWLLTFPARYMLVALGGPAARSWGFYPDIAAASAYVLALAIQTAYSSFRHGPKKSLPALPLIFLTPLCYGIGFWRGLFTRLERAGAGPAREVVLEKIDV